MNTFIQLLVGLGSLLVFAVTLVFGLMSAPLYACSFKWAYRHEWLGAIVGWTVGLIVISAVGAFLIFLNKLVGITIHL